MALCDRSLAGDADVMRNAIALNTSVFTTHRMVAQYALHAYAAGASGAAPEAAPLGRPIAFAGL